MRTPLFPGNHSLSDCCFGWLRGGIPTGRSLATLVFEKICIPGSATPQLELPVSTTSQPANSELFARYRRLLPQNWPESNVASVNWSRIGHDLRLKITSETLANYPALDFFPLPGQ